MEEKKKNRSWIRTVLSLCMLGAVICLGGFLYLFFTNSGSDAESVTVSQDVISMKINTSYQLSADVYPSDSKNRLLTWTSSDESVVKVNSVTGYLEAGKKNGNAIVTAKVNDEVFGECYVYVGNVDVTVESLKFNTEEINMSVNSIRTLSYKVTPPYAAGYSINFKSSDTRIATVDKKGEITSLKEGSCVITAYVKGSNVSAQVLVNVKSLSGGGSDKKGGNKTILVPAKSITVNKTKVTLNPGNTFKLEASVNPSSAEQIINYQSSNTDVATVDSNGLIKANKVGECEITLTTSNGKYKKVNVTVNEKEYKIESLNFNTKHIDLDIGGSYQSRVTVVPTNITASLHYESEDSTIANVDSSGKIYGNSIGTTYIIVYNSDESIYDSMEVVVRASDNYIALNDLSVTSDINVLVNQSKMIEVSYDPNDCSDKRLIFRSSDINIATVSDNGLVVGKKKGTTTINVSNYTGTINKTVNVKVGDINVTSIKLNNTSLKLTSGSTSTLTYEIKPDDAAFKPVSWSSSDESVATVSNGVVTGINGGTAIITVQVDGTTLKSTCTVTVEGNTVAPTGLNIDKESITIKVGKSETIKATVEPSNSTNKILTWTSDLPSIATVDTNGKITGKAKGTCVITVLTSNGIKKEINVTVTK